MLKNVKLKNLCNKYNNLKNNNNFKLLKYLRRQVTKYDMRAKKRSYQVKMTTKNKIRYSSRKNNCQKIQSAHSMITKRDSILSGSCFCKEYSIIRYDTSSLQFISEWIEVMVCPMGHCTSAVSFISDLGYNVYNLQYTSLSMQHAIRTLCILYTVIHLTNRNS